MALVVADRVKETTTTTGTGAVSLGGAAIGFVAFSAELSDGDTTYYAIVDNNNGEYEVGVGTYTSGTNSLSRDTVFESSNAGSKVNLQTGSKDVFVTYPASKSMYLDASGAIANNQTFSGTVTLNGDPVSSLQAATKQYVDTVASASIHYHSPVRVESPVALTVTYDNGTAGVGATLTNAGTQAALTIDGITLSTSDRVLIYAQTDATQNGVYTVTDVGSGSTNWVMTRATDADTSAPSDPDSLGAGDAFFVQEGNTGAGELYVMNTTGTITFGTTDINFVQISSAQVYTGGTGINITGSVISTDATLAEITVNGATTSDSVTVGGLHVDATTAIELPTGTEAQRPTAATGMLRFNTDAGSFEGYNGTAWGSIGGGASGGGGDAIFYENDQTVTTDYTVAANKNAMSTGPLTINSGVTVTVETGARWVII